MTKEFTEHLPHYPDCKRPEWWQESEAGGNSFTMLRCWGCDKSFIIVGNDELYDYDGGKKYIIKTKKRVVEEFVGYEVI